MRLTWPRPKNPAGSGVTGKRLFSNGSCVVINGAWVGSSPPSVEAKGSSLVITLTVRDESTAGARTNEFTLDFQSEQITIRELIRSRVFQEVEEYNAKQPEVFRGMVQPTNAEVALNGFKLKKGHTIDPEPQFEKAVVAFEQGRILILVDEKQVEELETEIEICPETQVSFIKLVPLVGG